MRSFTLGRIWGIPIRVSASLLIFVPILAWLIGSGAQIAFYADLIESIAPVSIDAAALAGQRWTVGILAALGLFLSVAVHELGHAYVAMRYGIEVESITLWILGGLARLSEFPKEWNREFWIAVAGPATSVLFAGVCLAAVSVIPSSAPVLIFVVGWLAVTNVVLTVFNLLPAFPMDGGRVLRALLARSRPYGTATRIAAGVGKVFAVLFAIVGVLAFSPILLLVAFFVYGAASSESRMAVMGDLLEGLTVGDIVTDTEGVTADATLDHLFPRLLSARRSDLPVVDRDGTVVGAITADAMRAVDSADYQTTRVESLVTTDLPRVDAGTSAFDALMELSQAGANVALVERDGRVVGLVSQTDFSTALGFQRDVEPF
ncbi:MULTISPECIES: site-2 protease family protein [Salinibaculum]|uniref:site-2 protease family protein n=1 Tax=Salinibaculum TaxID=2732368 RepID=UPI0030CE4AB9